LIFSAIFQSALLKRAARLRRKNRRVTLKARTRVAVIRPASATAQLLWVLASSPHRFWSYGEILAKLLEKKNLSWSLRYCYAMGWIERTPDARSERYLRYRITALGTGLIELRRV